MGGRFVRVLDLFKNPALWSAFLSWLVTQIVKAIIYRNPKRMFSYGGMPSAHTATVAGLAWMVGRVAGFNSAAFAIAGIFFVVVVVDAIRLRGTVERLALTVNEKLGTNHRSEVGHDLKEVFVGFLIGTAVAWLMPRW